MTSSTVTMGHQVHCKPEQHKLAVVDSRYIEHRIESALIGAFTLLQMC